MIEAFRLHQHQCLGWSLGIGPSSQLKSAETAAGVTSLQNLQLLSFMWLLLSLLARQLRIRVRAGTGVRLEVSPSMPEHARALSELHIDICLEK